MHILIIGGAGYIGSHTARAFLDAGHAVTVFDDLSSGRRQNLFDDAAFVEGDIREPGSLAAAFAGGTPVDGAVHLAALKAAGASMVRPQPFATTNLAGTVNVLNALVEHGVRRLVFSSSAAVYGEPRALPMTEDHLTAPENFYGYTKLAIEELLGWYDRLCGLRSTSLRYFNAAGYDVAGRISGLEEGATNLVPVLMEAACGLREEVRVFGTDYDTPDGSGVRDYIHVNDLASAHVLAMEQMERTDASHLYNVGTGAGCSVLEMVALTREITGRDFPVVETDRRPGDPSTVYASSNRIREALGWSAEHSDMRTILETTWAAYQKHHG